MIKLLVQYGPASTYIQIIDVCTHKFSHTFELKYRQVSLGTFMLVFPVRIILVFPYLGSTVSCIYLEFRYLGVEFNRVIFSTDFEVPVHVPIRFTGIFFKKKSQTRIHAQEHAQERASKHKI